MPYLPPAPPSMWSTRDHERRITDVLADLKGKRVVVTFSIPGMGQIDGKLKDVLLDSIVLGIPADPPDRMTPVFIMLSAVATIEGVDG